MKTSTGLGTGNGFPVPQSMGMMTGSDQGTVSSGFCFQGKDGLEGGSGISWSGLHFSSGCSSLPSSCNADPQISSILTPTNTAPRLGLMNNSNMVEYTSGCSSIVEKWGDVFGNSSSHAALPSQLETMHPNLSNNFYSGQVSQQSSGLVPSASQSSLIQCYARGSSMNLFNGTEQSHVTSQQEPMKSMNHDPLQSLIFDASNALKNSLESIVYSSMEGYDHEKQKDTGLVRILQKELTNSDVSNVGRIVLPKKEAEANLPQLGEKELMVLRMKDFVFPYTWNFKYRYWPNNKSRMYVLETTGDFVRAHGLRAGDFFIICKNLESGNYVVMGEKELPMPTKLNEVLCSLNGQNGINGNYNKDREEERFNKRKRNEEQFTSFNSETYSSITKSEEDSLLNLINKFGGNSAASTSSHIAANLLYKQQIPEKVREVLALIYYQSPSSRGRSSGPKTLIRLRFSQRDRRFWLLSNGSAAGANELHLWRLWSGEHAETGGCDPVQGVRVSYPLQEAHTQGCSI
ncbi:hypothetical protein J5N97_023778 [Dioscorea zingiberensis]|uniref:TF-B3 domain-containing protein n=1 Tax=Dioscorea zingiberensis TaxID=325984 RepID=A0A9D5C5H1_9LILI|nr:hypothetical protein J5N97_023778 [Dioscorea zingiberensis]